MIKQLASLLAILPFAFAATAQNSFSLEEAKNYALEHHHDALKGARNEENARQYMVEVRGMGLPQVNLSGSFTNFINIPVQVVDASTFNPQAQPGELSEFRMGTDYSASGTFQVDQLIFNGSYIIGLQVAKYYRALEATNTKISQEEVIFNVIQAYELAAVALENKTFLDSLVIVTEELVEKQKAYLDLEMMLQEDFDQLKYSLAVAQNAALSSQIQYDNAIALLKFSMGFPAGDQLSITDDTDALMTKHAIASGALTDNITYQMMNQQVQLSEYNLKNNKVASYPSLNGFFQHTYNAYRNEFNFFSGGEWYPQTLWGLQLNVPIFSGLQRHAKVKQAEIRLMNDQEALKFMEQSLQFQEVQLKNNFRSAESRLALEEENLNLATSIYEKALIREEIGSSNSIAVTQKYNQLIQAQAQMVGAKVDLFNAKLQLDKLYNNILSNQ